MSKVSVTTRDKRSIAAEKRATQNVSNGAHNHFQSPHSQDRSIEGLVPLGAFNGYIRALCLIDTSLLPPPASAATQQQNEGKNEKVNSEVKEEHKTIALGVVSGVTAWCAEQDGTISVRRADTGALLTKQAERVQSCGRNTFVCCLTQVGSSMWVGYSDGCLRVFDIVSKKLLFEKKRHAGALNAIAHGSYLVPNTFKQQTLVFTASDDFKIMEWKYNPSVSGVLPAGGGETHATSSVGGGKEDQMNSDGDVVVEEEEEEEQEPLIRATGHALLGHSNAVKCLLVDGDRLYSGSDDGFVRMWTVDATSRAVNNAPFPMHCHRDGVRFIALHGDYVIAAGAQGHAVAKHMDTGEIPQVFYAGGGADTGAGGGGIKALHLVQSTGTLFIAHLDGNVDVWDANDFTYSGTVTAHQAQMVSNIAPVARAVETTVLCLGKNGSLVQLTIESDSFLNSGTDDVILTTKEKTQLQSQVFDNIEVQRNKLMADRDNLAVQKAEMDRLNIETAHEKRAAAVALMNESITLMKRNYLNKCLVWMQRSRNAGKRKIVADCLAASSERGMRFLYFSRLAKYTQASIQRKQKQKLSDSILVATEQQLRLRYLKQATEYVRRKAHANTSLQVIEAMMSASDNGFRAVIMRKWARFLLRQRELAKRKIVAFSLMKHSEKGSMVLYWHKFVQGVNRIRYLRMKEAAAHAMRTTTTRGYQMLIFRKLQRHAKKQKQESRRRIVIDVISRSSEQGLARLFVTKWRNWVRLGKQRCNIENLTTLKAGNDEMVRDINDPNIPAEDELDRLIAEAQKELIHQKQTSEVLEGDVAALTRDEKQLKKRLTCSVHTDPSKSIVDQMNQTSALLKPSILHIRNHMGVAVELFQKLQASNKDAAAEVDGKKSAEAAASPASPAKKSTTTTSTRGPAKSPAAKTAKPAASSPTKKKPLAISEEPTTTSSTKKLDEAGGSADDVVAPKQDSPEGLFHAAVAHYRAAVKTIVDGVSGGVESKSEDGAAPVFTAGEFWPLDAEQTILKADFTTISNTLATIRQCLLLWDHIVCKPDVSTTIAPNDTTFTGKDVNEFIQNASWAMEVVKREKHLRGEGQCHPADIVDIVDLPRVVGIATGTTGVTSERGASAKPGTRASSSATGTRTGTASKPKTATAKPAGKTSTVGTTKTTAKSSTPGASAKPAAKRAGTPAASARTAVKPAAKKEVAPRK